MANNNNQFQSPHKVEEEDEQFDYAKRSQWLRAAVLGANDGLVSTASLMMGVGAVRQDVKAMILTGFAGLVAGACSMAIGEFVSVYSQYDIEVAQMKRDRERSPTTVRIEEEEEEKESLPNPVQAAAASGLAFSIGAMVPLLAASFIKDYKVRLGVMFGAVTLALVLFGWIGAVLGKAPVVKSSMRVLIGGWVAMALTFALTKSVDSFPMDLV
ncbi:Vacuolar iron transporter homolog 4 [Linum grandiflorum]